MGNYVLEIKGMFFYHWMILFSTSCFANLLGLNISSSFNSVKVIYILIPMCIIPQLLFSGIIVSFDKLHPYFASKTKVPIIGNVMASRWAYEAMSVTQFKDNEFEKLFFEENKEMSFVNWKKDQWASNLESKLSNYFRNHKNNNIDSIRRLEALRDGDILVNEIKKEMKFFPSAGEEYTKGEINKLLATVANKNMEKESYHSLYGYINTTKNYYRSRYKVAEEAKDKKLRKLIRPSDTLISKLKVLKKNKSITSKEYRSYKKLISRLKDHHFQNFKTKYNNNSLEDFVTNSNTLNFISEDKNNLIQKSDPIYLEPYSYNYLGAHFYAPSKNLLGRK